MKTQGTVLIVDDQLPLRRQMKTTLRDNGYRVMQANDGYAALDVAKYHRGPIHVLITEYMLAGPMDGLELAVNLKQIHRDLAVLCTSEYDLESNWAAAGRGWEAHADSFLPKPFSPKELLRQVQACL